VVLQTYALFGAEEVGKSAVLSIFSSVFAIAFVSSTISFDFDIDPVKRLNTPDFYGYIPDTNRAKVFVLMTVMTAAHVLMKVLGSALILRLNKVWFMFYMVGDMSLYFTVRVFRGDFRYWLRLDGVWSWIASILVRLIIKTVTDFTLLIQFRNQMDIGGSYFSASVVLNQIFCFISVHLYTKHLNDVANKKGEDSIQNDEENALQSYLWNTVVGLFVLSMFSFGGLLKSIKREYFWTFFDTRTGPQFAVDNYRAAETDSSRFGIFGYHPSYFDNIAEELMKWLTENWDRWEEEKPEWFTAVAISTVPEDMLPMKFKLGLGGNEEERRESLKKMVVEEEEVAKRKDSVMVYVNQVVPVG